MVDDVKTLKAEIRRLKRESKVERGFTDKYIKLLAEAEAANRANMVVAKRHEARVRELEEALQKERAHADHAVQTLEYIARTARWSDDPVVVEVREAHAARRALANNGGTDG